MQCSANRSLILIVGIITCISARADFNDATKAYLLGNFEKARYEALVAATDGMPEAQMLLGQLYFNGEGVEKDIKIALYWYEKAATQDFPDAQFRLGTLYFEGKHNIPKDYDKAYQWLNKALENGNKKAEPILEGLYKLESGNVVNLEESLDKLQEIASNGNKQARYLLSERLLKGNGLPQDKARAVTILSEDARQGFVKAQKRLGELYFYGDGVAQDYFEAYAWSMAYAGTRELGGLAREGKQTARSSLRKLDDEMHHDAYVKSKEYFEKYVLPYHPNAREVGPEKYRIVVRSRKAQLAQAQKQKKTGVSNQKATSTVKTTNTSLCEKIEKDKANPQRTKQDVTPVLDEHKTRIFSLYNAALREKPELNGKVVYEIEINPDGKVTRVDKRPESSLNASAFEASLVNHIKQIDFCKKGTTSFVVAFPIDFIPSKSNTAVEIDPALERTKKAVERSQASANNREKVIDKLALTVNPNLSTATKPKPVTLPSTGALTGGTGQTIGNQQKSSDLNAPQESPSDSGVAQETKLPASGIGSKVVKDASDAKSDTGAGTSTQKASHPETNSPAKADKIQEKRTYREIHNVFIRHRSRLNEIYQRAYVQQNNLQGRIIFSLTIDPEGKVTDIGISSSDLDSTALEEELIDYIKNINFTRKNTVSFDVSYPLDFLP